MGTPITIFTLCFLNPPCKTMGEIGLARATQSSQPMARWHIMGNGILCMAPDILRHPYLRNSFNPAVPDLTHNAFQSLQTSGHPHHSLPTFRSSYSNGELYHPPLGDERWGLHEVTEVLAETTKRRATHYSRGMSLQTKIKYVRSFK